MRRGWVVLSLAVGSLIWGCAGHVASASASCEYNPGDRTGAPSTEGTDTYFFRVVRMHLKITLVGHWQAGSAVADMTETDAVTRPPRDAQHPIGVSPPFQYSWPDCSRFHGINVYGPQNISDLPFTRTVTGRWSDPALVAQGLSTAASGSCDQAAVHGGNGDTTGPDVRGNLVTNGTRGQQVKSILALSLNTFGSCMFGDGGEFADFSDVSAGNPGELRFIFPSRPVAVSVATLRTARPLTFPLSGDLTFNGRWGKSSGGALHPGGTVAISAAWHGSFTLVRYAHCRVLPLAVNPNHVGHCTGL